MAKETGKDNRGLTLVMKIGPKEGDLVGNGKLIAGKEKPKVIDLTDEMINKKK